MKKNKKPKTGYENKKNRGWKKFFNSPGAKAERKFLSELITPFGKKVSLPERIVKFLIYIGLRIVIRPHHWKHPKKNFEIIDRTYKRIISNDFTFIPTSIAFYFIMAFMPLITILSFIRIIPGISDIVTKDELEQIFKNFIPGVNEIIKGIDLTKKTLFGSVKETSILISIIISFLVSLWIASAGFSQIVYTQSYLYKHKYVGGYWANRIKGIFIVLSLSIFLAIVLFINAYLVKWTKNIIWLTRLFLYIGLFILILVLFVALFKLTPRYKIKVKQVFPGAMVATIPTTSFLSFFGYIISLLSYNRYGPVGAIMYIAASALAISYFMFLGLITNVAYYNTFVGETLKRKKTLSKK